VRDGLHKIDNHDLKQQTRVFFGQETQHAIEREKFFDVLKKLAIYFVISSINWIDLFKNAGLELLHISFNILQHFKEDTLRMLGLAIINAGF
jgi:hypothetical protein